MSAEAINSEWRLNDSWTFKDLCDRVECEGLMLTTIFPALDIVWNPSSSEDMSSLRDSLGLLVVADDRLAHHFCPTTVFFMRSILPSHRSYTIIEAQHII